MAAFAKNWRRECHEADSRAESCSAYRALRATAEGRDGVRTGCLHLKDPTSIAATFAIGQCPTAVIAGIRATGDYGTGGHSGLMPANLITLAHFRVSSAMILPNSAGDVALARNPRSSYFALM